LESDLKTGGPPPPVNGDPAAKQSKTAVMARLLASGYFLADDVKNKAIAWDTGNLTILQKLEALGTVALNQAEKINEKYKLSEKKDEFVAAAEKKALEIKAIVDANENVQLAKAKVSEIDSRYGISTKAAGLYEQARQKAHDLKEETKLELARQAELSRQRQNEQLILQQQQVQELQQQLLQQQQQQQQLQQQLLQQQQQQQLQLEQQQLQQQQLQQQQVQPQYVPPLPEKKVD